VASLLAVGAGAARILLATPYVSPHDLGVLAIALVALGTANALSDTGVDISLVRHPGDPRLLFGTAFLIQALRGVVVGAVLFACAPIVASWCADPAVVPVVRAIAIVPVLAGLANPAYLLLTRRLEFGTLAAWNSIDPTVTLVVSVWLAASLHSVWALVIGTIAGQAVRSAVTYAAVRRSPGLSLRLADARVLLTSGRWIFGSRILMLLSVQGDNAFVGVTLGTTALGLYAVAFRLAELPAVMVSSLLLPVALPVLSAASADRAQLRTWFVRLCRLAGIASAGLCVALLVAAPAVLRHFVGDRWAPALPLFRILVVAAFVRSVVLLAEPLLHAVGRPSAWFSMNVMRVATMAAAIVPLTWAFGLEGVAGAVLLGVAAMVPLGLANTKGSLMAVQSNRVTPG
jgi:PST family polysaccharide transporter/lipopolysaccharide exporter